MDTWGLSKDSRNRIRAEKQQDEIARLEAELATAHDVLRLTQEAEAGLRRQLEEAKKMPECVRSMIGFLVGIAEGWDIQNNNKTEVAYRASHYVAAVERHYGENLEDLA